MTQTKKKHDRIAALLELQECEQAAYKLFSEIMRRTDLAAARRIFRKFGLGPSPQRMRQIRKYALLDRYDVMRPKPNAQKLAGWIAEENKRLPSKERHGPRGSTNQLTLDKYIRRLLKERAVGLEKGTWQGPIPD